MEMWCPDDTGRESWDWVGMPAWGEHASTPQSGVEATPPVKTEPPQIVLLLLFWKTIHKCVYPHLEEP